SRSWRVFGQLWRGMGIWENEKRAGGARRGGGENPPGGVGVSERGGCKRGVAGLGEARTPSAPGGGGGRGGALTVGVALERKRAGVLGIRCAMTADDRVVAGELLGQLGRQFPNDPDVLYLAAHAYSDLSMRAAGELAQKAPLSVPARRMNAEALEMQAKWDEAAKEYE